MTNKIQNENIEVIEIEQMIIDPSPGIEVGKSEWFLSLIQLTVGFFEYHVVNKTWYVSTAVKKLLRLDDIEKEDSIDSALLYDEAINEIIDNFLISTSLNLTHEILLRNKHEPWQTFTVKCEKIMESDQCLKVRGLLFDVSMKNNQNVIDNQLQKLQALGQLTSGVSHDFNNQLNGILGYVALMKNMTQDQTLLRYMDGIERSVHHSTELTRQLLAFSHKADDKRTNLDLVQIVNDTVSMLKHTIDRRIEIHLNIDEDSYYILGDASQLNNAILNLCINARDSIKNQGAIELTLTQRLLEDIPRNILATKITPNDYAVLEIKDTGNGIEEAMLSQIFKPFFTTKAVGKGTGMGLSGVVDTVGSHNGALTVDSKVGEGTSFTIYLPINHGIDENIAEGIVSLGSGKVLLIDDEPSNLEITHALLETFGYSITSFSEPKSAIDHYTENIGEYDCILLDVIMPDMSGVEVFKALKLINPQSKIILLTGISDPFELDFILRQGVEAYVPKPVDHRTLSSGVYKVLNPNPSLLQTVKVEKLLEVDTPLNITYALERIAGNVQLYFKIAYNFRKNFYMIVEELAQLIASNQTEALRKVHTIKGLAGQLGADELYEYSRGLNRALTEDKPYKNILTIFLEEFIEVADELLRIEKIM